MFKSNLLNAGLSVALLISSASNVFAQPADEQAPSDNLIKTAAVQNSELDPIEVIEVWGQKRKQKIEDVTLAITVIDADEVSNRQLKDTTQLGAFVPNLKISNNAGEGTAPAFNLRGVGMIDYNTSTISPIAIYLDDVVAGSANNLSVNLFDLEHIEVLRGPQGTLFGRNTTGGAILLKSKQPEAEFGGYFNASVAQYDSRSMDGALNVPLSERTALRFAVNHQDYQFSTNNLMPGQPDGGLKQTNMRLMLKSEFEQLTVTAKLHAEDWSGKPKPIASLGINHVDGGLCSPSQAGSANCFDNFAGQVGGDDFWDVNADTADREHSTESWGSMVKLAWQLNPETVVTSISGYRALDRFHSWDSDGPSNLIEGSMGTNNTLFSQELTLSITVGDAHWLSGLYYVDEDIKQNNDFDLFRDFRAIPDYAAFAAQFFYDNRLQNRAVAVFSQYEKNLTSKLTLTAGLRYTDERTDYHANADLDVVGAIIPDVWDVKGRVQDDEFSGKLALNQKISDHSSIYYSYARGYKSGGYNAGYTTTPLQAAQSEYAPETLDAWEVGSYLQIWQNNARLQLAAFYYDYQDQQVFVNQTEGVVLDHVLKNAGDSKIYGVESSISVTPSKQMQWQLAIGYLPEANMGKFNQHGVIVEDNRLPFASKWNISGAILHESEISGKMLTAQLNFDYQSRFYFDQEENPYSEQGDFIVFNGRLTLELNDALSVSLWGKNLTNSEYSELRFNSIAALGAVTELKAQARQLGAALSYQF